MYNVLPEFREDWCRDFTKEDFIAFAKEYYGYLDYVGVDLATEYCFYGTKALELRQFYKDHYGPELDPLKFAVEGLKELLDERIIAPVCVGWKEFLNPCVRAINLFLFQLHSHQVQYEVMRTIYTQREIWLPPNYDKSMYPHRTREEVFALWESYLHRYEELLAWDKQREAGKEAQQEAFKQAESKLNYAKAIIPAIAMDDIPTLNKQAEKKKELPLCPLITPQAVREGKVEAVMEELQLASKGPARHMVHCLKTNEALGYVRESCYNTEELHKILVDYFQVTYSSANLRKYRN